MRSTYTINFFRNSEEIKLNELERIAKELSNTTTFNCKIEIHKSPLEKARGSELNSSFFEEGCNLDDSFVFAAFVEENMPGVNTDHILIGQSSRGCLVRVKENSDATMHNLLHQLGHVFGIEDHCTKTKCVMYPLYIKGAVDFKNPFCSDGNSSCGSIIEEAVFHKQDPDHWDNIATGSCENTTSAHELAGKPQIKHSTRRDTDFLKKIKTHVERPTERSLIQLLEET
ncbi:MAG: hypothetical protein J7K00_03060 [Candidatus Diapherotrites archaeon]|nr:hypothetical protein [Candidatus Diapherotrites archaeon]